jgi:hypothetical protein
MQRKRFARHLGMLAAGVLLTLPAWARAQNLTVKGMTHTGAGSNPLRFSSGWTGYPDGATNQAEISNDTGTFKTLMIVGNKSAGVGRRVSIWDRLDVNGTLVTTGHTTLSRDGQGECCSGGNYTLALAEATASTGNLARLQFHNSGQAEGFMALTVDPTYGRLFQFASWQAIGMGGWFTGNLRVDGNAFKPGGGGWAVLSDARLKTNVQPLRGSLARLLQLRGVTFEWKHPEQQGNRVGQQTGMIAQEVEKVFPDWVIKTADGTRMIEVRGFEALAVESMRELKADNDQLRRDLDGLRREVRELRGQASTSAPTGRHAGLAEGMGLSALGLVALLYVRRRKSSLT